MGDSITVGTGAPRWGILADDSWVAHVVAGGRVPYGYDAAVRGQKTKGLLAGLPAALRRRPEVVVITTGTNDDSPSTTLGLIETAIDRVDRAGALVVLATVPPREHRPSDIAVLNDGIRRLAARRGCPLIDFHAALADGERFRAGMSDDGWHPTVEASRLMAAAAEKVLAGAFPLSTS